MRPEPSPPAPPGPEPRARHPAARLALPLADHVALVDVAGAAPRTVARIPTGGPPRARQSADGRVLCLAEAGRRIEVWDPDGGAPRRIAAVDVPDDVHVRDLALKDGILLVGAHGGGVRTSGQVLARVGLDTLQWRDIAIPPEVLRYGKGVDALVLDGDRLVAVDDIVFPKYFLEFDARIAADPRFVRQVEIEARLAWEQIETAARGDTLLATLSRGAGRDGAVAAIGLFDLATLAPLAFLVHDEGKGEPPPDRWHGVAFAGDRLLVAAGSDGVLAGDTGGLARDAPLRHDVALRALHPAAPGEVTAVVPMAGGRAALVAVARGDTHGADLVAL